MRTAVYSFVAVVVAVAALWLIGIPGDFIKGSLEKVLAGNNMRLEVAGLNKGLFYDFRIDKLTLAGNSGPLLTISNLTARIEPLSLFLLKLNMSFRGEAGKGTVTGRFNLLDMKGQGDISIKRADIEGLPFLSGLGIQGKGALNGDMKIQDGAGDARLSIEDMALRGSPLLSNVIPLERFGSAKGVVGFSADTVRIDSLALEGKGIYARIKGNIKGGQADLRIEIMPQASQDALSLPPFLENYKVSPGYYCIPVKGSLPNFAK